MSRDRKRIEELKDRAASEREDLAGAARGAREATRRWTRRLASAISRATVIGSVLGGTYGAWRTRRLLSGTTRVATGPGLVRRLFSKLFSFFRRKS